MALTFGRAMAADAPVLVLTCSDYRPVGNVVKLLHANGYSNHDGVSLAGASLGVVSDDLPSPTAKFWNYVATAKTQRLIRKVVVIDHRECAAYKSTFGRKFAPEGWAETTQHKDVMAALMVAFAVHHPDLGLEFYLMAPNGSAETITF